MLMKATNFYKQKCYFLPFSQSRLSPGGTLTHTHILVCAKGTRAEPGKQKASVIEQLVVDNSTNKIFVFGKGKNCFHGPKRSSS